MWPENEVYVFPQALPETVMAMAAKDANALADCDNFWISKERILEGPDACKTPAELTVCLLYQQHVGKLLPASWQGAEYWVQVYQPGRGLGFHFDKDEHLFKSTGQMVNPIWSSVLYLTGSTGCTCSSSSSSSSSRCSCRPCTNNATSVGPEDAWDGARQAPTVILQQLYDSSQHGPVPAVPSRSAFVWPVRGSYCLFDGRLGHGVLDSCSSSRRATLLINWWAEQPQSVHALDDVTAKRHLTRLTAQDIQLALSISPSNNSSSSRTRDACNSSSSCAVTAPADVQDEIEALAAAMEATGCTATVVCTTTRSSSSGGGDSGDRGKLAVSRGQIFELAAVGCSGTTAPAAAAGTTYTGSNVSSSSSSSDGSSSSSDGSSSSSSSSALQLSHCQVAASAGAATGTSGIQLVDAVMASNKLSLVGADATNAVVFDHPGFVLYPVEPEDARAAVEQLSSEIGAVNSRRLQTLAAFVSQEVLSEECSDGVEC